MLMCRIKRLAYLCYRSNKIKIYSIDSIIFYIISHFVIYLCFLHFHVNIICLLFLGTIDHAIC